MHNRTLFVRILAVIALAIAVLVLGYPAAFIVQHGWNPAAWPANLDLTPMVWLHEWRIGPTSTGLHYTNVKLIFETYWEMASELSPAFAGGGVREIAVIGGGAVFVSAWVLFGGKLVPLRDRSNIYGSAEWASRKDLARLNRGLEIGLDPETGNAVRIRVEGNLLTIAPPRTGKTGGFIIPNLVFPEVGAWSGPAVVIDPKGDAYRAVRRRREEMGKTVRCLDPLNLVEGADRWNPLCKIDPTDVLYLQSVALALLPPPQNSNGNTDYFQSRASDVIVAAILATIRDGKPDLVGAANLLMKPDDILRALQGCREQATMAAEAIIAMEPRNRDSIISTAQQATLWLRDTRMQSVVQDHTFEMIDLASGDVDLFIVLPADDRKVILAPYVRWLLADLFTSVRQNRPAERIVTFIDEAFVLGRFDAILRGAGELPGYGISLWTFWQTRQQIIDTYGQYGAETLIATAEMTNIFNLSKALPDEMEHWSRAIGTYTGVKPTRARDAQTGRINETQTLEAVRLVPATDLAKLLNRSQVVFLTSTVHTPDPIKLTKTRSDTDPRFNGLVDLVEPVGRIA